jgi:nitrogen fixation NifU-like protein
MYTEKVVKRFENPRFAGELKDANAIGTVGNPACGDIMRLYLKINKDTEVIEDVSFKTFGCAAAIASTDVACELIKGKTIAEALKITNQQVVDQLGTLPPHKIHCSVLAEESIAAAVKNYYENK